MLQQTSLLAFAEVRPKLGERQARVLDLLEEAGPLSNRDIARLLHWDINMVTPRCLELRQKGLVEPDHVGVDHTGRKVNYWRAAPFRR